MLQRYDYIRKRQRELHSKLIRQVIDFGWIRRQGNRLYFCHPDYKNFSIEIDPINKSTDYFYHSMLYLQDMEENFPILDAAVAGAKIRNAIELQLIETVRKSPYRLYEIKHIDRDACTLTLWDVGERTGAYQVIDRDFSRTAECGLFVALQLLDLGDFCMSTGIGTIFNGNHREIMRLMTKKLRKYERLIGKTMGRLWAFDTVTKYRVASLR